jgi:hypothetical protein
MAGMVNTRGTVSTIPYNTKDCTTCEELLDEEKHMATSDGVIAKPSEKMLSRVLVNSSSSV